MAVAAAALLVSARSTRIRWTPLAAAPTPGATAPAAEHA
jgi:hypothetical protein